MKTAVLNYHYFMEKIPNDLYDSLKLECEQVLNGNPNKNKKRITGLSNKGVPTHYDLKVNNVKLYDYLNKLMIRVEKEINYFPSLKFANKNVPLTHQIPWINYQKKHEYVPNHTHDGVYSYSIWIKSTETDPNDEFSGYFNFLSPSVVGTILSTPLRVDKSKEGYIVMFPSPLMHCVYPFYDSDDYRISISGNIMMNTKNG